MNNSIATLDDINYLAQQSQGNINMILSGMTALMNDTDNKVDMLESQNWFQRMIKTVLGKNKITQNEIKQNHDKLNAYMSEAISELYNRNCIDSQIMMSLGTQLNELYAEQTQLKQMLGAFVSKLNEKIDSIDNFHMLTTEIDQGVYNNIDPIVAICKIISQFDNRILKDNRKLDIIKRSLIEKNILSSAKISLHDYLTNIINIPIDDAGQIYIELSTIRDNFMANIILETMNNYHFLPAMARKMKNKKAIIEDVIDSNNLDKAITLSAEEIYSDFIDSKISVNDRLMEIVENNENHSSENIDEDLEHDVANFVQKLSETLEGIANISSAFENKEISIGDFITKVLNIGNNMLIELYNQATEHIIDLDDINGYNNLCWWVTICTCLIPSDEIELLGIDALNDMCHINDLEQSEEMDNINSVIKMLFETIDELIVDKDYIFSKTIFDYLKKIVVNFYRVNDADVRPKELFVVIQEYTQKIIDILDEVTDKIANILDN